MPISKKAIDAYLTRDVEALSWIKELTPAQVAQDLNMIDPPPHFTAPLRTDQQICFLLGVAYPELLLMTDLGLGKTVVSLELLTTSYRSVTSGAASYSARLTSLLSRGKTRWLSGSSNFRLCHYERVPRHRNG